MRHLVSRLFSDPQADELLRIAEEFREITEHQRQIIGRQQGELLELKLEYTRWSRDLIENFLVILDTPEIEVRDLLIEALRDFDDEIARMEEFSPA